MASQAAMEQGMREVVTVALKGSEERDQKRRR